MMSAMPRTVVQGIGTLRLAYASAGNSNGVLLPAGGTTCHL